MLKLGLKIRDYLLPSFGVGVVTGFLLLMLSEKLLAVALVIFALSVLSVVVFAVVDKLYEKVVGHGPKPQTSFEVRWQKYLDKKAEKGK